MTNLKKVDTQKKDDKGKKNSLSSAISGTEKIREWDDHRIGIPALVERLHTNKDGGLTSEQAK